MLGGVHGKSHGVITMQTPGVSGQSCDTFRELYAFDKQLPAGYQVLVELE